MVSCDMGARYEGDANDKTLIDDSVKTMAIYQCDRWLILEISRTRFNTYTSDTLKNGFHYWFIANPKCK